MYWGVIANTIKQSHKNNYIFSYGIAAQARNDNIFIRDCHVASFLAVTQGYNIRVQSQ